MADKRMQANFRIDAETQAEVERLRVLLTDLVGLKLNAADVWRLALRELSAKHPKRRQPPPAPPKAEDDLHTHGSA